MQDEKFLKSYKNLNKEQKEAVDTVEGPVMVIAGPGTGKTTILTLRIANILRLTDTPPSGILAITYTEAGVKAIRKKLLSLIGKRAHEISVSTFHGFARSIINEYPDHFLHLANRTNLSDIEQEALIRSILEETRFAPLRPFARPDAYVSNIIKSIDESKREALTPDMVLDFAKTEIKRIQNDPDSISTRGATKGKLKAQAREQIEKGERTLLFAEVFRAYETQKTEVNRMDFNDLIIELLVALRKDELLLRLIQERYLYFLIDEHQDTNDAQNLIISLLAEFFENPNLFIVGDEKQAIYRFQGASVENFLLLKKRWPAMRTIYLTSNYRSQQKILDAAYAMIENNYGEEEHQEFRTKLVSSVKHEPKAIDVITGENTTAIEKYLIEKVTGALEVNPHKTIAIIVRRNFDRSRVIKLLESAGVSVSAEQQVDIFSQPIGKLFFSLVEYLYDPTREGSLAKTLIAGMWDVDFEKAISLIRDLSGGRDVDFDANLPKLKLAREALLDDSPVGFLLHVAELSGFVRLATRKPAYSFIWRGIVSLAESIAISRNIKDPHDLLAALLEYQVSAESRTVKVPIGTPDSNVIVLTAHGSKGLEFDEVFMPYVTEEAWIGRARGTSFLLPKKKSADNDIRDIRRLFYVALTRAREHVTILTSLEEADQSLRTPLRFIDELDKNQIAEVTIPRIETSVFEETAREETGKKINDLAKTVLLKKGLSVTALNHFLKCETAFLYQNIFKLPVVPNPSMEKGKAMHVALSRVWESADRSEKMIEKIIRESVVEFIANSYLARREKEVVLKELSEAAAHVAHCLVDHFAQKGEVSTERWFESVFKTEYKGISIEIPIHGRLDALLETEHDVLVFDYKTKRAMSPAEIKGETKTGDGHYFRQLIFYKMLLSHDERFKNKNITVALAFVSPDKNGRCSIVTLPVTAEDIENVEKEIKKLIEAVWSGDIARHACDDSECLWCGLHALGE